MVGVSVLGNAARAHAHRPCRIHRGRGLLARLAGFVFAPGALAWVAVHVSAAVQAFGRASRLVPAAAGTVLTSARAVVSPSQALLEIVTAEAGAADDPNFCQSPLPTISKILSQNPHFKPPISQEL